MRVYQLSVLLFLLAFCCSCKEPKSIKLICITGNYSDGDRSLSQYISYDSTVLNYYFSSFNFDIFNKAILIDSVSFFELYYILDKQKVNPENKVKIKTTVKDNIFIDFMSSNEELLKQDILIDRPEVKVYFESAVKDIKKIRNKSDREMIKEIFESYIRYADCSDSLL